jgi:hypothetical protein
LVARVHVTSDKMLHGFGSFPGSPWSLSTSKSTGPEPMPLSNQTCWVGPRLFVPAKVRLLGSLRPPCGVPRKLFARIGSGKAADLQNRSALHLLQETKLTLVSPCATQSKGCHSMVILTAGLLVPI